MADGSPVSSPLHVDHLTKSVSVIHTGNGSLNYTLPFYRPMHAHAGFGAVAAINVCSRNCNGDQELIPALVGFSFPVSVNPGDTEVVINWTLAWNVSFSYHPGTCTYRNVTGYSSTCSTEIYWTFNVMKANFIDESNHRRAFNPAANFSYAPTFQGTYGPVWSGLWENETGCIYYSSGPNAGKNVCGAYGGNSTATLKVRDFWSEVIHVPSTKRVNRYRFAVEFSLEAGALISTSSNTSYSRMASLAGVAEDINVNMADRGEGIYLRSVTAI